MPIPIVCPSCGQTSYVSDALLGSRTPCPGCGRYFVATPSPGAVPVADPAGTSSDAGAPSLPPVAVPAGSVPSAHAQAAHHHHTRKAYRRHVAPSPFLLGAICAALVALVAVGGMWLALRPRPEPPLAKDAGESPDDARAQPVEIVTAPPVAPEPAPAVAEAPPAAPAPPPRLTTEEITARSEGAVALVKGKNTSGTGFLVEPGLLVTNAHVIETEFISALSARFPSAPETDRGPFALNLVYEDAKRDLAIFKVAAATAPLTLAPVYTFRRGQEVTVIGNPGAFGGLLTLENAVSRGVMSNNTWLEGQNFYQLTIAINPGNSGGPVIDSTGQVIGVVTLKTSLEEGLAFCIPVEDVRRAVAQVKTLRPDQAARADSVHRLVLAVRALDDSGRVYATELQSYVQAMDQALRERADIGETMAQTAQGAVAKLKLTEQPRYDELQPEVMRLTGAADLPADTRQAIIQLWSNYAEMKTYVEHPPSDVKEFHRKTLDMRTKHRQLVESLKRSLGPDLAERVALVPAQPRSPGGISGTPAAEDDQAAPASPALHVVDFSLRPETKAGYIKVFGKVKNLTGEPLRGLVATVHVRDPEGTERKPTRIAIVPETLAPGGEGSFFTRLKLYSARDRYKVDFSTAGGTPVRTEGAAEP